VLLPWRWLVYYVSNLLPQKRPRGLTTEWRSEGLLARRHGNNFGGVTLPAPGNILKRQRDASREDSVDAGAGRAGSMRHVQVLDIRKRSRRLPFTVCRRLIRRGVWLLRTCG
jgi:hypothetical protein